jgi:hypothetical protein
MNRISRHKIGVWLFVAIFSLFNVGIPVATAACPMTREEASTMSCCSEQPDTNVGLTSPNSFACCMPTLAAEPDKSEYLQTKEQSNQLFKSLVILFETPAQMVVEQPLLASNTVLSPSPQQFQDIPIFTSSLLI